MVDRGTGVYTNDGRSGDVTMSSVFFKGGLRRTQSHGEKAEKCLAFVLGSSWSHRKLGNLNPTSVRQDFFFFAEKKLVKKRDSYRVRRQAGKGENEVLGSTEQTGNGGNGGGVDVIF